MNIDFIAGLIDADGCFQLGLETYKNSKTNYIWKKYRRKICVDITNKDKTILNTIVKTLQFGFVVKVKKNFAYRINSYKNIQKFIDIFENRFHGKCVNEIILLKYSLHLCLQPLSQKNCIEFIHCMYASNTQGKNRKYSIHYYLKKLNGTYMPHYINTIKKQKIYSIPINGSYVSGYTQGDGSFNLSSKNRFVANFTLTDTHKRVLCVIQDYLQLPKKCIFCIDPKTTKYNQKVYRLQIDRIQKTQKYILPHFDAFPVYGIMFKRYVLYKQGVFALASKKNNIIKFQKICAQLKKIK